MSHGEFFPEPPLPDLDSFKAGDPERREMTDRPTVVITWMHTNEYSAPTTAYTLYASRPDLAPYVNYICGNPDTAAKAPEEGFGETDLNRSFGSESLQNPKSYEEHRAKEILAFVANARYVLDLHNTVCTNFGKVAIVDERRLNEPAVREILAASPLDRILLMSPEVADLCLLGRPEAPTISFEYENELTESEAVPDMLQTIENLVTNARPTPRKRAVFRMTGRILKTEDPGLHVKNWEAFTDRSGQTRIGTFLSTGPRSYREDPTKDYCGFYVTREELVL